jgi:hypothetical protein
MTVKLLLFLLGIHFDNKSQFFFFFGGTNMNPGLNACKAHALYHLSKIFFVIINIVFSMWKVQVNTMDLPLVECKINKYKRD